MIGIFTQEGTYIKNDLDEAFEIFEKVYGSKLANEAYDKLKNAPLGYPFRKNGGPLIKILSKQEANVLREKERALDRLLE